MRIIFYLSIWLLIISISAIPAFQSYADTIKQETNIENVIPKTLIPVAAEATGRADSAYHIQNDQGKYNTLTDPNGLTTKFSNSGVTFTRGEHSVRMVVSGSEPIEPKQVSENKLEYKRGNITEWYVNSPFGLEQGFTLQNDPDDTNKVVINLDLDTDLKAEPNSDTSISFHDNEGNNIFTYGKLFTFDSKGKELASTMKLVGSTIEISVDDTEATYPIVIDPFVFVQDVNSENNEDLAFFPVIASYGDVMIVGLTSEEALIYRRNPNTELWEIEDTLTASDGEANDGFGSSVGIYGTYAVVGAPAENSGQGAAYIFEDNGDGTWSEVQKITASDGAGGDTFGANLDISGDFIIVSSADAPSGAAYIFERNAGVWPATETQKLTSLDPMNGDGFGTDVAIEGTTAAISALGRNMLLGAVFVFERNEMGVWVQVQEMSASNGTNLDEFGISVDIFGGVIVVGAPTWPNEEEGGFGAVFIFERDENAVAAATTRGPDGWPTNETQQIEPSMPVFSARYGQYLSIYGNIFVVGAPGVNTGDPNGSILGTVYIYMPDDGGTWVESQTPIPAPPLGFNLGRGVAVTGGALFSTYFLGGDSNFTRILIYQGLGSIAIVKETDPAGGTGFGFEGVNFPDGCGLNGMFTLDDGMSITCMDIFPLPSFLVQETDSAGFELTNLTCSGNFFINPIIGADSVDIDLLLDEAITCTYTNTFVAPPTSPPPTAPPIVRNVPTLSMWGLASMAVVLGILGLMVLRRKRVSE